jgi:EAL domain-containing protein (putative c-di-GMP-specific phosphodiesterase class I)
LTAHLDRRDLETGHIARTRAKIQIVLADGGVHPVFQPIVDLASGRTFGLEALSRFKCEPPQSPDRWFADAESVGLRAELEQHAAAKAVDRFRTHASDVFLSLNASPESLNGYLKLAAELGDRLVLEITEHSAIDDYDEVTARFEALRGHGVRLAVDDVGAGFASLRHVLQLAPDFVKLDASLTRDIDGDRRRQVLTRALTEFAGEFGAAIVAEGVETAAELETLRGLGVSLAQGFHLGRPRPL